MIGWVFIAVAKSDRVLRGHSMMTIERAIRVVHSIAVTASHSRAREHQRKCGYTNQSEVRHNRFSFSPTNEGRRSLLRRYPAAIERQHVDLLCSRHRNAFFQRH